jgi:hypothetical protein
MMAVAVPYLEGSALLLGGLSGKADKGRTSFARSVVVVMFTSLECSLSLLLLDNDPIETLPSSTSCLVRGLFSWLWVSKSLSPKVCLLKGNIPEF